MWGNNQFRRDFMYAFRFANSVWTFKAPAMPTLQILLRVTMVSFSSSCVRLYLIRRLKGKKCLSSFLKKLERRGVFNAASFYQSHRNNIMRHGTSLPFTDYFTEVCSNCCCSLCGTNTQQLICASGISVFSTSVGVYDWVSIPRYVWFTSGALPAYHLGYW